MSHALPYLDAQQIRRLLSYPQLIDCLRDAFASVVESPLRHRHDLDANGSCLLLMPAWNQANGLGIKLLTVMPQNQARNLPTVNAIYILFDRQSGAPRAILDGEALTHLRTAAASVLAARYLARSDSKVMLLIGVGSLGPELIRAYHAARPALERILLWGRHMQRVDKVTAALREEGIPAETASDLEAAVRASDIITCCTTSTSPIVHGAWLKNGAHVDLVGGFRPDMREADDDVFRRATVFVDTYAGALAEAGDLLQPLASGALTRERVVAELAELARGQHQGRIDNNDITVFKSVGTALEDLVAAELCLQLLEEETHS